MTSTLERRDASGMARPQPVSISTGRTEAVISLPLGLPMLLMVLGALAISGLWCAAVVMGPWESLELRSGLWGIGVTAAMALIGLVIISPWKPRKMGDWLTMWLAGTVFRMLVTPVVVYLLYSAASPALAAKPLVLAVALTYMVMVLIEAGSLASHVRRSLPSP